MKKFYYLFASMAFVLVVIMACDKSSVGVDEIQANKVDELQAIQKGELSARAEKSDICHWDADNGVFISINIADAAFQKHLDHGDYVPIIYYEDADGDGFGNSGAYIEGCEAPIGYVEDKTDCVDNEPTIYPSALEICGDGIDNNCNDLIDEECATDFIAFYVRNSNTTTNRISAPWDIDMFITENAAGNGFSCATPRGGQKVGYGTIGFDGMQVNTIQTVNWDKLAGATGLYAYMNMWVTDGTNYAIISSENNYLGTDFGTRTEWKIFETDASNLDWLFASGTGTVSSQYLMRNGVRVTLADLGNNIVLGDPGVYTNGFIGTGAPLGGYGFNLIWGDTRENFIGEGYSLENVSVTIAGVTYEASN